MVLLCLITLLAGTRKSVTNPCSSIIRYNGVLTVLYQRDMKETDAAAAILANSDVKALKAKYARFEKKHNPRIPYPRDLLTQFAIQTFFLELGQLCPGCAAQSSPLFLPVPILATAAAFASSSVSI